MNRNSFRQTLAIIFLAALLNQPLFSAATIPLESPIYEQLELLRSYGIIHAEVAGTKPYTRMEVALLVSDGLYNSQRQIVEGSDAFRILNDLAAQFHEELLLYAAKKPTERSLGLKSPEFLTLSYDFYKGNSDRLASGNFEADAPPLTEESLGRNYSRGHNFNIENEHRLNVWSFFDVVFDNRLEFLIPSDEGDDDNFRFSLRKLYSTLAILETLQLEVGRDAVSWGAGDRSKLLFSKNSAPLGEIDGLPLVKISAARPLVLPPLGAFKYTLFVAGLEEERGGFPQSQVWAARIDSKPFKHFEWALSEAVIIGGEGGPESTVSSGAGSLIGFGRDDPNYSNQNTGQALNRLISGDFTFRVPDFNYSELFSEILLDDVSELDNSLWNALSIHAGIHAPRVTSDAFVGAELEYTHTSKTAYGAMTYDSGFTRNERFLGYFLGPFVDSVYSALLLRPNYRSRHRLFFEFTQRGVSRYSEITGVDLDTLDNRSLFPFEKGFAFGWNWGKLVTRNANFRLRFEYERILNFANISGNDVSQFFAGIALDLYNAEFRIETR